MYWSHHVLATHWMSEWWYLSWQRTIYLVVIFVDCKRFHFRSLMRWRHNHGFIFGLDGTFLSVCSGIDPMLPICLLSSKEKWFMVLHKFILCSFGANMDLPRPYQEGQTSLAVLHLGTVCDRFSCKHYYRVCNCCRQYGQRKPSWFESDPMHYADSSFVVIEHRNWCERPRGTFALAMLWNGCGSCRYNRNTRHCFGRERTQLWHPKWIWSCNGRNSVHQFSAIALENAWKWFWNRRTASNESTVALHFWNGSRKFRISHHSFGDLNQVQERWIHFHLEESCCNYTWNHGNPTAEKGQRDIWLLFPLNLIKRMDYYEKIGFYCSHSPPCTSLFEKTTNSTLFTAIILLDWSF